MPSHATTSQFVARMYTEVLGRAPDESGWTSNALSRPQSGAACHAIDFTALANSFYTSGEYNNLGYTPLEKAVTLYRGLLNREPDESGLRHWATQLASGVSITTVIGHFTALAEFNSLKNLICSSTGNNADPIYRWGTAPAITIGQSVTPTQGGWLNAAQLNNMLAVAAASSNKTVALEPRTVVYADAQIRIPAGVTLTTNGVTRREQYARMARIVRTAHYPEVAGVRGAASLVVMESGAKLNAIWTSGQREATPAGVTLEYRNFTPNVFIRGGTGGSVTNSRMDSTTSNAVLGIDGSAEGVPCTGAVISNNLVTGYLSTHYGGNFTDGFTVACEDATITGNHIVDASDVGIILFRAFPAAQKSRVQNNIIVSAGVSAFAALSFEPYVSPVGYMSFAGADISSNRFWTSPDSHFDIGIAVGTKAWGEQYNVGGGAYVSNNTNAGIASVMQVGIGVDGMISTAVSGNQINFVPQANGRCSTKAAVVVNPTAARATTGMVFQAGKVEAALHSCAMSSNHN